MYNGSTSIADVDGDGNLDLLITGRDASDNETATLYLGDGSGGFTEAGASLTGVYIGSTSIADVDGDGNLDLLITGEDANDPHTAKLYLGNGNGGFTEAGASLTGVRMSSSSIADVNGDGNQDLLITGRGGSNNIETATVYLGDGSGGFTEAGVGLTGVEIGSTSITDVDGDGNPDLLITGLDANDNKTATVYLGDGSGGFSEGGTGLTGVLGSSSSIADVEGNGELDLVVTGRNAKSNPTATVYNNGGADITAPDVPPNLTAMISPDSISLEWGSSDSTDVDKYRVYRDTAPIDSSKGPGSYTAYDSTAVGDTTFADTNVTPGETYYYRVTAVDTASNESGFSEQASGQPPIAITGLQPESGAAGTTVRIRGTGFSPTASDNAVTFGGASATVDSAKSTVIYAQVPSGVEGPVEITLERSGGRKVNASEQFGILTNGDSVFTDVEADITGLDESSVDWGDYDQDGVPDLVVSGLNSNTDPVTKLYRNENGESFSEVEVELAGVWKGSVAWGDYNGDGLLDLLVTGQNANSEPMTALYQNEENGGFTKVGASLTDVANSSVEWGDFNGDGKLDLVISGYDGSEPVTKIYRNEGGGDFEQLGLGLVGLVVGDISWGDYNGDGLLDLVVSGQNGSGNPVTNLYRNEGEETFTKVGVSLSGVDYSSLSWGDYDDNGTLDLVISGIDDGSNRLTKIYRNEGEGTFTEVDADLEAVSRGSVAWGDYTGDGAVDLLVSGQKSNNEPVTKLYRNGDGRSFTEEGAELVGAYGSSGAWSDFDRDGGLDLIVTGENHDGDPTAVIYESGRDGDTAPPEVPPSLTSTVAPDSISLTWSTSDSADVGKYRVYRDTAPIDSTAGPSNYTAYDSTAVGDTTFTDTSVQLDTTYHYRVTAVDTAANESGFSNQAQGTLSSDTTPSLRLTRLQPESGVAGTSVRLYGTGFTSTIADNTVTFGDTEATVDRAKSTVIYAQVPDGVSDPVPVTVEVGGEQATSSRSFQAVSADLGERSLSPIQADLVNLNLSTNLVRWGDYDQDGDLDLLVAGNDSDAPGDENPVAKIYRNDGGGQFTDINAGLTGVWRGAADWGDIDGDGDLDVILTGHGPGDVPTTVLYRNEGGGEFSEVRAGLPDVWSSSVDWGDYDGDGDLDLAMAGWTGNGFITSVFENDGSGGFTDINAELVGVENGSVRWGDWSGGGALDLVVTGDSNGISTEGGHVAKLYENNGRDTFVEIEAGLTPVRQSSVDPGNYNGDGQLDLVVSGENVDGDETTTIYRNDGGGSFSTIDAGVVGVRGGEVEWGDYNGDGRADLAVNGFDRENGQIANVYVNEGDSFSVANHRLDGVDGAGLDWGDYDGDGDLDLAVLGDTNGPPNEGGLLTRIYRNGSLVLSRLAATTDGSQVQLSWTAPPSSVQAYQVYRSTDSFADTSSAGRVGRVTDTTWTDNSVTRGQAYHYRVVPVAPDGVIGRLSEGVSVTLPASMVSSKTNLAFGDATSEDSYRLVALPGGKQTPFKGTIIAPLSVAVEGSAGPEGDYRAYREEGASEDQEYNVVECGVDGGVSCSFKSGRGLWMLLKRGWDPPESISGVELSENGTYSVSLNPGWNLVSNPFAVDVSWAAVQAANGGGLSPLYERKNGDWAATETFNSATTGTGYYVKNEAGLDQMVLPHPTATDSTTTENESSSATDKGEAKRASRGVRLGAYQNGQKRSRVELLVHKAAEAGLDALDIEAPPAPFANVVLRAVAEEDEKRLLRAARPMEQKGQQFPLRLTTSGEKTVTIRADSLNLPDRYEAVLVERPVGRTHDLREGSAVLQPDTNPVELVLLVGTPSYVDKKKSEIVPERLTLLGNYPNPVSRSTTIEYALPEKRSVRLSLYDVLGRRVQVLARGQKRAGFHRVQWAGARKLASGIYFYRLQAGGETKVKKMTIVR